jgi:transposase-like protein
VLDRVPKQQQAEARALLCAMPYAETRQEAEEQRDSFIERFGNAYPDAAKILRADWERMVTFYGFPKEHWKHLRTTNIVESPFAAGRRRTTAAKRVKKVANATALIWRVLLVAERSFRRLEHPQLLAEVAEGAKYQNGIRVVEKVHTSDQEAAA